MTPLKLRLHKGIVKDDVKVFQNNRFETKIRLKELVDTKY